MKFLRRFNRSDRDAAIIIALVIIVSIVLFPFLSEQDRGENRFQGSRFKVQEVQRFRGAKSEYSDKKLPSKNISPPNWEGQGEGSHLSPFDPNTASASQLLSLGLSQWQVQNILKYRSRGGRYRVKEDFARLYGLTLEKYRQLEPYITIAPQVMAADVVKRGVNGLSSSRVQEVKDSSTSEAAKPITSLFTKKKLRYGETVDINTADTAMLKRIPGIGDYFAMRIVELRKRKQAFTSPEELLTIRDFPETALTYMTASQNFPPIYVNRWSQKELASHPLLNYTQARDIISLRRVSGIIQTAADLAALPSFNAGIIKKLIPLLRYDSP